MGEVSACEGGGGGCAEGIMADKGVSYPPHQQKVPFLPWTVLVSSTCTRVRENVTGDCTLRCWAVLSHKPVRAVSVLDEKVLVEVLQRDLCLACILQSGGGEGRYWDF